MEGEESSRQRAQHSKRWLEHLEGVHLAVWAVVGMWGLLQWGHGDTALVLVLQTLVWMVERRSIVWVEAVLPFKI